MDQKRDLRQNVVSSRLFLVGFLILFAVISLLLYLNPEKGSVFKGQGAEFQGVTGADVVTGATHASGPSCILPPTEIISWWNGETSGTIAKDVWDGHDGTLIGATTTAPGKVGQAFSFDGISSIISVLDHPAFDFGTESFTIEGWIKTDASQDINVIAGHVYGQNGYSFSLNDCGVGKICFWQNDQSQGVTSGILEGEWYHVAVVRFGTLVTFYVNGGEKGSIVIADNIPDSQGDFTIAKPTFTGLIDELTVYNKALSPNEIQSIYNADSTGKCREELICNDGIDDDQDGKVDCDDNNCALSDKQYFIGTSEYYINTPSDYQIDLVCPTAKADIYNSSFTLSGLLYTDLKACDEGTEDIANRVTLCQAAGAKIGLEATNILKGTNKDPYTEKGITFLYEISDPKEVSLHLNKNIADGEELRFALGVFTANLLKKQQPIIVLNGEYYSLYYQGEGLFEEQNLRLKHVPEGFIYTPAKHPGANVYVFKVLGDRTIQFFVDTTNSKFILKALAPGEAPRSYVVPHNLTKEFEVQFSLLKPVKIIEPVEVGQLTVCQDDNAADTQQVLVCRNNDEQFTLKKNNLTTRFINSKDYGFLYEFVDGKKRVSVFSLHHPQQSPVLNLDYNNFINSMISGRRATVRFSNNLYLLQHPVAPTFSILNLKLIGYKDTGTIILSPSGSEDFIEFPTLDGGKMFLQRNYGVPPPPFSFWALTSLQLTPVNLEDELFTSFSSLGKINVINPDLGTLSVNPDDVKLSSNTFQLKSSVATIGNIDLIFKVPKEVGTDALFYYHSANINQGVPVKTVSIYRLYKLTPDIPLLSNTPQQHYYNDDFIKIFTGGHELALQFGNTNSYYLLGHDNPSNQLAFFDINKLILSTVDKSQTFIPTIEKATSANSKAIFTVPEGKIEVFANDLNNNIIFRATTSKALQTVTLAQSNYSALLTTSNSLAIVDSRFIGSAPGSFNLEICNQDLYKFSPAVDVCYNTCPGCALLNEIIITSPQVLTHGIETYILESNGLVGDAKAVTIRRIVPLNSNMPFRTFDWTSFTKKVMQDDLPVFNISDSFYLPVATDNLLSNFAFQKYPDGEISELRNVQQITPVTFNGSYVLYDKVLFAKQGVSGPTTAWVVNALFTLHLFQYLPDNGEGLEFKTFGPQQKIIPFVLQADGESYHLGFGGNSMGQLRGIRIFNSASDIIFVKLFAEGDSRILKLNKIPLEIKVEDFTGYNVTVSLRRITNEG